MGTWTKMSVALIFASAMTWAQETASISGTVTDSSGAVAVGVTITITHVETNTNYTAVSNGTGFYINSALPVGAYQVSAEAEGFKKAVRTGLTLEVGDRAVMNFVLQVGEVADTVEVAAAAGQIDTSSATLGKVIENKRIMELPINSRSGLSLVSLTPNVRSQASSQSGFADRGSAISSFSINGGLTNTNMIVVDGVMNIGTRYGDTNVNMSSDAIQEFKVESGVVSAQYNYLLGGVVNFVTKAGTNSVHGVMYEFLRNNDLDGRNYFAASRSPYQYNQYGGSIGGPILKNKLFYFGNYEEWRFNNTYDVIGTVPTAAWRKGDLSNLRTATGALIPIYDPHSTAVNPSGSGYVRSIFPGNMIPPAELDRVIQNVLSYYPLPNRTPTNAFTFANNYQGDPGTYASNRQELIKIDYTLSPKDTLSGRYILTANYTDNAAQGQSYLPDKAFRQRLDIYNQRNTGLTEAHVFSPSLLNQITLGVAHNGEPFGVPSLGAGYPQKLGLPASWPSTSFPYFVPSSAQGIQGWPAGFAGFTGHYGQTTEQVSDNVSWVKGQHSLKLGVVYMFSYLGPNKCDYCSGNTLFDQVVTGNPQSPSGTGSGLASELLGAAASSTIQVNAGASYINLAQGYYAQDDWKVSRRLTLNLGLRWDYQQVPRERHDGISNFNPDMIATGNLKGALQFAGPAPGFGPSPINPDYKNWSPRFGLAWDIFGNSKTVIRAGYGIYYQFVMNFADSLGGLGYKLNVTTYSPPGGNTQFPAFYVQNGFPTPVVPPIGNALGPAAFLGNTVTYDEPWGRTPYSQQFSFTVQHQLPKGILLDLGYSGNQGTHLRAGGFNLDQLNPVYLSLGNALQNPVPNPYAGQVPGSLGNPTISLQQSLRQYPYYNSITDQNSHQGSSTFRSFIMSVEKRYSRGFVLLFSYSKAKGISNGVTNVGGTGSTGTASTAYQEGRYDLARERSIMSFDTPQRLATSLIYELPFGRGKTWSPSSGFVNTLVSGWQVNSIMAFESGLPLEITGANNNLANRPNSTGVSAKLDNPTISEWFNTQAFVNPPAWTFGNVSTTLPDVRAPGNANVDFSVSKLTKIGERWSFQLRGEAFNVANHANFRPPNTAFVPGANGFNSSATFGTITAARDPRIIQLGVRLLF